MTLLATLVALIVISFSAVILIRALPLPAFVALISRVRLFVVLCVCWKVRSPSPVLSNFCVTAPSSVMSGSL